MAEPGKKIAARSPKGKLAVWIGPGGGRVSGSGEGQLQRSGWGESEPASLPGGWGAM